MLRIKAHGERWGLGGVRNGTMAERKINTIGLTLLPAKTSLSDTIMQCKEHRFHCRLTCISTPPHPPTQPGPQRLCLRELQTSCNLRTQLGERRRVLPPSPLQALNPRQTRLFLCPTFSRPTDRAPALCGRGCPQGVQSLLTLPQMLLTGQEYVPRQLACFP